MLSPSSRRWTRSKFAAILFASVGALAVAAPAANAGINSPPKGHVLIVFPSRDFVSVDGYAPDQPGLQAQVFRGGNLIASSLVANAGPDGIFEVNHPGGTCWDGITPDILPQDVVRVTTAPGTGDETTVRNVAAGVPEFGADNTSVTVHGTAVAADGVTPLPLDQIEQRIVASRQAFSNGKRTLRASASGTDGDIVADPAIGAPVGGWVATYTGLSPADMDILHGKTGPISSRGLWLGQPLGNSAEITIFEQDGVPGPASPCAAPAASAAIGGASTSVVNSGFLTAGAPLTVTGVIDPAVANAVSVSVGGAPVSGTVTGNTWSASIPADQLAARPDGTVTVTATFSGAAPPPAASPGTTLTLTKDTIAPAAPTASPGAGAYSTAQSVTLSGEAGATLHYATDGSPAGAGSATASGQINVSSSLTLKAVAVDAAGNVSAGGSFAYTITPLAPVVVLTPAPVVVTPAPVFVTPAPVVVTPAPVANTTALAPRKLVMGKAAIAGGKKLAKKTVAKKGITVGANVPSGTTSVEVKFLKGKKVVAVKTFRVSITGHLTLALTGAKVKGLAAGSYTRRLTPARTASDVGLATNLAFSIG
jgi:hypothetical protein